MNDVERTTTALGRNAEPLLNDGRELLGSGKKLAHALASDDQLERYRSATRDLTDAAARAKHLAGDAEAIMGHVQKGKGTLGALVMDEAVYDDLQELLRDLKHNPWKFFWRQ
ncbi:MAG: hypothetical protein QM756_26915 [Polyangiaceae bacterium]